MGVLRCVLAVVAGVVVGIIVISATHSLGHLVYPPPPNLDWNDREAVSAFMAAAPWTAYFMILLAYAAGPFCGGLTAAAIARRQRTLVALIVGYLFTLAGAMNLEIIPHAFWFAVVSTGEYLPFAFLGSRLIRPRASAVTESSQ